MEQINNSTLVNQNSVSPVQDVSPVKGNHTFFSKNKWNILLVLFIPLIIGSAIGFFIFTAQKKNAPFAPGTTYEGSWKTPGRDALPAKLSILSRQDNTVTLTYAWGIITSDEKQTRVVATLLPDGNSITWDGENKTAHFTFQQADPTHLSGTRKQDNITAGITMTRK